MLKNNYKNSQEIVSFFIFDIMKKILLVASLFVAVLFSAQFNINVQGPSDFRSSEAYLYKLNGSKDILLDKGIKKNNTWSFNVKEKYEGFMKVYFPEINSSISLISENRDVLLSFTIRNNKLGKIDYKDESNKTYFSVQDQQKKKEQILPALYQISSFYQEDSSFGIALKNEINNLSNLIDYNKESHAFINYYSSNYQKFLTDGAGAKSPNNDEIIHFLNTSSNYLETSTLLRPILISFLSNSNKNVLTNDVDKLLNTVNIETPRGQTILSELIDIFNVYSLKELKDKYLAEAKALKCTINDRLSTTIKSNDNTAVGSLFPNNKFINPQNTKAKTLHDVKANKKIVIFWSSTCPHCEKEIGEMITKYNTLKEQGIEIIGLSLDSDKNSYVEKTKILPWINDTELKGWYSSYIDIYNVHATPTFYILDSSNKIIASPDNFIEVLNFLGVK